MTGGPPSERRGQIILWVLLECLVAPAVVAPASSGSDPFPRLKWTSAVSEFTWVDPLLVLLPSAPVENRLSVVTDTPEIFVFNGDTGDGTVITPSPDFRRPLSATVTPHGEGSPQEIIAVDTGVSVIDLQSGKYRWRSEPAGARLFGPPTVFRGPPVQVLVEDGGGSLYSFGLADGTLLWTVPWNGTVDVVLRAPLVIEVGSTALAILAEPGGTPSGPRLRAIDLATRLEAWSVGLTHYILWYPPVAYRLPSGEDAIAYLDVDTELQFRDPSRAISVYARNGTLIWDEDLPGLPSLHVPPLGVAHVSGNALLYLPDSQGTLRELRLSDGTSAVRQTGCDANLTRVMYADLDSDGSDEMLVFSRDGPPKLCVLDLPSLKLRWSYNSSVGFATWSSAPVVGEVDGDDGIELVVLLSHETSHRTVLAFDLSPASTSSVPASWLPVLLVATVAGAAGFIVYFALRRKRRAR